MVDIAKIDKNLAVETTIVREGLCFYDAEEAPFQIYGIFKENGVFRRMPRQVAEKVSAGVYELHTNTAGGRVRFVTDSPYVAIKTEYIPGKMPHFALTGSAGFDMYAEYNGETRFIRTFVPPFDVQTGYESIWDYTDCNERLVTINFPLYSTVSKLYIGLKEGSVLKAAPEYRIQKPIVYYGSSITQGGCASKPGSCYQSILSRRFDCDYINLGFSGSAKGEDVMVDYIKGLDMSIFVLDYDHNAPSHEHLIATHSKMYEAIRAVKPDLPILILPRPKYHLNELDRRRFEIVHHTYLQAKAKGDKNLYFLDGKALMGLVKDNGTVDGTHPTDSGFFSMAYAIGEVFEKILMEREDDEHADAKYRNNVPS